MTGDITMKIPTSKIKKGKLKCVKDVYTKKDEAIKAAKKLQKTSKTHGEVMVRKAKLKRNDGKDVLGYAVTFKKIEKPGG
jgi:hypothetical protein